MHFCTLSYYFFSLSLAGVIRRPWISWRRTQLCHCTTLTRKSTATSRGRARSVSPLALLTDRPIDWLMAQPRSQGLSLPAPQRETLGTRLWLTHRPSDRPTDRLTDWLIDWICCCWQRGRNVLPLPSPLRASVTCCCWHHLTSFGSRPALTRWARLKSRNWGRKLRMHSVWKLSAYSSSIFINTKR